VAFFADIGRGTEVDRHQDDGANCDQDQRKHNPQLRARPNGAPRQLSAFD
jgi:hypothetical protein